MYYVEPGKDMKTPSWSEAVSSCLASHDSQKTYIEAVPISITPHKKACVTRPGHLKFDGFVFDCFSESLELNSLLELSRQKFSF